MLETLETLVYVIAVAVVCAGAIRERLESDPDPIDEPKQLYAEGVIDEPELERRSEEA